MTDMAYVSKRTVALIDVLGFKKKVMQTPITELSKDYEYFIRVTEFLNKPFGASPSLFPTHPNNAPWCTRYIFSDTIILISIGDDALNCLKLLVYTWRLSQFLLGRKMPFRGAIAHDEIYVNLDQNIVIGKALTKAYELEHIQQWIGIAIDKSVEDAYPELFLESKKPDILLNTLFLEYPVPFKDGSTKQMHTINWRFNLIVEKGTRSLFSDNLDVSITDKVCNTLAYAKAVIDTGKIYVHDQEHLPIELRSFYIGSSEPPYKHGDNL